MRLQSGNVQARGGINRAVLVRDSDHAKTGLGEKPRGITSHLAETLYDGRRPCGLNATGPQGGERYVHPALGARLVAAEAEERKRVESDPLSEREREVLALLALGHTNQEIAALLYISVRTAETHRAHIMQKLGLASRAELVRYALDHGLIER